MRRATASNPDMSHYLADPASTCRDARRRNLVLWLESPRRPRLPLESPSLRCESAAPDLLYVVLEPRDDRLASGVRARILEAGRRAGLHVDVERLEPRFTGGRTVFAVRDLGAVSDPPPPTEVAQHGAEALHLVG